MLRIIHCATLKSSGRLFLAATLLLMLPSKGFSGGAFDLRVNDVSGLDAPWPLMGGLPFPEGALHDASQIRIVDGQSHEVPAQIDVAATWRDGSIRWALAGFMGSPQARYRVEFGPGVSRGMPETPLRVERDAAGNLTVDTGAAVYEFLPDRLLPESGRMGQVAFLSGSGAGAYLVDNHDRLSRVAGSGADIETEIVRQGPMRLVLKREGWYVTDDGARVARARAWFYFTAGSPYLRVTHSLIFTEDTNEIWVRDYGLVFRTPGVPGQVVFPLEEPSAEERMGLSSPAEWRAMDPDRFRALSRLFSDEVFRERRLVTVSPDGGEVYLLQDTYPHFLERDFRAVVGRAREPFEAWPAGDGRPGNFWTDDWLELAGVAGAWGDARFDGYGLAVVTPRLAEQFPKEIAFGPAGARVALWSGRSGRELDFRAVTLVNEYFQRWAEYRLPGPRSPEAATALALDPSNAQCAARTHDVWLLPRVGGIDDATLGARMTAAARPPLLQADPAWLCSSEAVGWPMHPEDREGFPEEEAKLGAFWENLMTLHHAGLRRTGLIAWGGNPHIRGHGDFFRISGLVDYALRRHVWGLYARSGDRGYYEYGARFNRFAGDWSIAHWTAGDKFAGGYTADRILNDFWSRPFYWGSRTQIQPVGGVEYDIVNWLLDYYLTGDEYALELTRLHGEAFRQHWASARNNRNSYDGLFMILRVMASLYAREWDEDFGAMAREMAGHLIDMDNPVGTSDDARYGNLYKLDRDLVSLYFYYRETGDESARAAFLQAVDFKYRFQLGMHAFGGQSFPSFLFAAAWRMTGNPDYLRVLGYLAAQHRAWDGTANITSQVNPTLGVPAMLGALAEHGGPVDPWPVATLFRDHASNRLLLRKPEGAGALELRSVVIMEEAFAEPRARLESWEGGGPGMEVEGLTLDTERVFQTKYASRADPRRWHVRLTVPEAVGPGIYQLDFPGAERVDVINSDAAQTATYAPEGFRVRGDIGIADYFRVEGVEALKINLGGPMQVRCPEGTVVIEADPGNTGELSVPVAGREGAWSVISKRPELVILRNVETLMSRSPDWLVTGAGAEPPPRFEMPSDEMAFVPGIDMLGWQALHLPDRETVEFPRGRETDAGYEFFPGSEGTVEFWFRPNWSSGELPTAPGYTDFYFLRAGSHDIQYRRGFLRRDEFAHVNLWAHGTNTATGFPGAFWFNAGRWYHLAAAWRTEDGQPDEEGYFAVYVNGRAVAPSIYGRFPGGRWRDWPGMTIGREIFHRRPADETISIGPLNGTIAQLRISNTVRYESDFEPPARLGAPDADTLVLFPLDGDMDGRTPAGKGIQLQQR